MKFKEFMNEKYRKDVYGDNYIFEVKLSRVWSHTKKGFIMLSAFVPDITEEKNMDKHNELKNFIRQNKLGFFEIDGVYTYDDGNVQNELSVFIPYNKEEMDDNDFEKFAKLLQKKFKQESVLYGIDDETFLIRGKDKVEMIGNKLSIDKITNAYSKLKHGKNKGRAFSFAFEGKRVPENHIHAYSFNSQRILF